MSVDGQGKVFRGGGHLDGQGTLGDQLARSGAYDSYAQDSLALRVQDEFCQPIGPP